MIGGNLGVLGGSLGVAVGMSTATVTVQEPELTRVLQTVAAYNLRQVD